MFAPYGGIDGWLSSVCEDFNRAAARNVLASRKKDIASIVQYAFYSRPKWIIIQSIYQKRCGRDFGKVL